MPNLFNLLNKALIITLSCLALYSCKGGPFKSLPGGQASTPEGGLERARKNIEEGKGISIGGLANRKTTYEFSTANPMWRASLEVLDFIPLTTVDYSGGMIITDWYSETDGTSNESLKITVRFLSNEIRADSLKIVVHKKRCSANNSCKMSLLPADSQIKSELRSVILRKASLIEKASKGKKSNKKN